MTTMNSASEEAKGFTLFIAYKTTKRGGRRLVELPDFVPAQRDPDSSLIKTLGKAFRWKKMLEAGEFTTISELAESEGVVPSYVSRVLRTTLLAPEIIEAIFDGRPARKLSRSRVLEPFPAEWDKQRSQFS